MGYTAADSVEKTTQKEQKPLIQQTMKVARINFQH